MRWAFNPQRLTISGNGEMFNYKQSLTFGSSTADWSCYASVIKGLILTIGNQAFTGCSSLKSITVPDTLVYIGDSAFYYCSSLTPITIPINVTQIGQNAFYGCILRSIDIPANQLMLSISERLHSLVVCHLQPSMSPSPIQSIGLKMEFYSIRI